jgi:tRNA A37 methylthiotransferase MiaB
MMGQLVSAGHELTPQPTDADVIVVNTCSFIDPAKQESVDTILEMAEYKKIGKAQRLIVAGCLVERYRSKRLLRYARVSRPSNSRPSRTFITTSRRVSSLRLVTPLTSRSRKAAIIRARSVSSLNFVAASAAVALKA